MSIFQKRYEAPPEMLIPDEKLRQEDQLYLKGKQNFLIRIYFYIERGLDIVNLFRNLILGIFAAYFALKIDNVWILVGMFLVALPILAIMGRYNVHTLSKLKEWLSMRFSTHYGLKAFDYQAEQVALLKEVRDLLKKLDKDNG